jgi:hypothetical protein
VFTGVPVYGEISWKMLEIFKKVSLLNKKVESFYAKNNGKNE